MEELEAALLPEEVGAHLKLVSKDYKSISDKWLHMNDKLLICNNAD